ncbi:MAG: endo-1,4-beta-xylanase [Fidelibacterota bacterium]
MKKRFFIYFPALLLALILTVSLSICRQRGEPITSLKDVFAERFYIGVALNEKQFSRHEPQSVRIVERHFNSLTPENCLKWEQVHPQQDRYDFKPADTFVEFGEQRGMFLVGHTLIWHQQTPAWVFCDDNGEPVDRETLLARMKEHIFTVVGRYKGRIQGWDVVNEAFEDDGRFRQSPWYEIIGEEYIRWAFEWAHQADPEAELYYNDFNMWYSGRRDAVARLVRELQNQGVPIHGIGLQGHWGLDYPPLDELEIALSGYGELGVSLMITELDMDILPQPSDYTGADISLSYEQRKELDPYPDFLPDSMQTVLAERYAEFFQIFNKYDKSISRVTFWGVHDAQSWRNYWPIHGRSAYPLLFDDNFKPKPALHAIIRTVKTK